MQRGFHVGEGMLITRSCSLALQCASAPKPSCNLFTVFFHSDSVFQIFAITWFSHFWEWARRNQACLHSFFFRKVLFRAIKSDKDEDHSLLHRHSSFCHCKNIPKLRQTIELLKIWFSEIQAIFRLVSQKRSFSTQGWAVCPSCCHPPYCFLGLLYSLMEAGSRVDNSEKSLSWIQII